MAEFKAKLNPFTGQLQLVPTNTVVAFKEGVATVAALPPTGNEIGDGRITQDTGHLYVWNGTSWADQGDIVDLNWSAIDGKPSSSVVDIDDAVSKKHTQNTDNTLLFSGNLLTGGTPTASSYNGSASPDKACDNDIFTLWQPAGFVVDYPSWWKYDFGVGEQKSINKIVLTTFYNSGSSELKNFVVEGSNDDITYYSIYAGLGVEHPSDFQDNRCTQIFLFNNSNLYRYYRITFIDGYITPAFCVIWELEMMDTTLGLSPLIANGELVDNLVVTPTKTIGGNTIEDITDAVAKKHTQNTDTGTSGNFDIVGELSIKVYSQDTEPTLGADNRIALWIDTNDNYRVYLLFRRGVIGSDYDEQVAVELA